MATEDPYRVVDSTGQGWHRTNPGYAADYGFRRGLEDSLSYQQLLEQRGPLRPVVPVPDADAKEMAQLLQEAGQKAAASVLAALHRVVLRHPGKPGGPHPMRAGREGSWESEVMVSLAWHIGCDLDEKPKRLEEATVAGMARIVESWITRPDTYTEVAENLAWLFGRHADQVGGWPAVADRWLQPGAGPGHSKAVIHKVGGYLLSTSAGITAFLDASTG